MPFRPKTQNTQRHDLLLDLYDHLLRSLGPSRWWPAETPFEVCIGAILTQNAPWSGVVKAIGNLRDLGMFSVDGILAAENHLLAEAIRPTVYYNQKAKRVKAFCRFLSDEFGGDVAAMRDLELWDIRRRLLEISGIGRETADSILLYALEMPAFVVDAYTKRIFLRHGMVDEECEYEDLQEYFEEALEPETAFYNEFHALLCRVGAIFCKRKPDCERCPGREVLGVPDL